MIIKGIYLLSVLQTIDGFMFDDHCNILSSNLPLPWNENATFSVTVPTDCYNGSFYWSYPHGHALLLFSNPQQTIMTICIKDHIGGHEFRITNTKDNIPLLLDVHQENWVCTDHTRDVKIVLKIDAPDPPLFMGAIKYMITKNNS